MTASQYHAQDELGQASFGYSHPGQAAVNYRDAFGNQIGSWAYFSPEGKEVRVSYVADSNGFRVLSNALPEGPVAPQDTPEVAAAKAAHFAAVAEAKARNAAAPAEHHRKRREAHHQTFDHASLVPSGFQFAVAHEAPVVTHALPTVQTVELNHQVPTVHALPTFAHQFAVAHEAPVVTHALPTVQTVKLNHQVPTVHALPTFAHQFAVAHEAPVFAHALPTVQTVELNHQVPSVHALPTFAHQFAVAHEAPVVAHALPTVQTVELNHQVPTVHALPTFAHQFAVAHEAPVVTHALPTVQTVEVHHQAPAVVHVAPVVHKTETYKAPVVHEESYSIPAAPVVHHAVPVVHKKESYEKPVVHHVAPVVKHVAPVVHHTVPIVHDVAPVVQVVAPVAAPLVTVSRFHSQDELGQASFGHATPDQAHSTFIDANGNQVGSYVYINPEGKEVRVHYTAGVDGFRVLSNALPEAPSADTTFDVNAIVQDTPEVMAARKAFFAKFEEARNIIKHPSHWTT